MCLTMKYILLNGYVLRLYRYVTGTNVSFFDPSPND